MTNAAEPPANLSARELPAVIVRPLEQSDLLALEWGGEYAHFRRLYADIYAAATQGRAALWVAEALGHGVVGQLFVQLNSARRELADGYSRGYIYGFRIQPAFRNLGIGTTMLQVAEADLRSRRYRWVTLNVGVDNPEARRLYERLGYAVVASEPGIWSYLDETGARREVHEPAWRMEKRLTSE
jgi:ribosomal protein S18 acetylase RimI-like enzyme